MAQSTVCHHATRDLEICPERDGLLTDFGKKTLQERYLLPDESYQDLFARVARTYADDAAHAARLYDYISRHWFMPATPVLANGGASRGLPISCFLNEAADSLEGIVRLWDENVGLASSGGGIGSYWGNLRSIGEKIARAGETSGIVPFIKVMDSMTLAISQGSLRRGSAAVYLPVHHPEIEEFVEIRKPAGGDHNRKTLNLHHGVCITDEFMRAVAQDAMFELKSPRDGHVVRSVSARLLWARILTTRIETGEPYLLFIDTVNDAVRPKLRELGLEIKTSNLCSEITLPTGRDFLGNERTAVCCLSSLNLEKFFEWQSEPYFIEDCMRFLDNVLEDFIQRAPPVMKRAVYSAKRERSVGLGVMGFHSFLQSQNLPFESAMSKAWNVHIFKHIHKQVEAASLALGKERGACPDLQMVGSQERFTHKMAIAPTASISIIAGGASPGIEPFVSNAYTHKTLNGSFRVVNHYLQKLLKKKGEDRPEVWSSIAQREGSVQHLPFLSAQEKAVFKTAFEIDQRWVVDFAGDRQPFVCQAQSVNLFLAGDVHKKELHDIHWRAWQKRLKSVYYLRSKTVQRAENTVSAHNKNTGEEPTLPMNYEECLACQ